MVGTVGLECQEENRPFPGSSIRPNLVLIIVLIRPCISIKLGNLNVTHRASGNNFHVKYTFDTIQDGGLAEFGLSECFIVLYQFYSFKQQQSAHVGYSPVSSWALTVGLCVFTSCCSRFVYGTLFLYASLQVITQMLIDHVDQSNRSRSVPLPGNIWL